MLDRLSDWWRDRRRRRAEAAVRVAAAERAMALARDAFAAAYPERQSTARGGRVEGVADGHAVTLTYGATRPPLPSWWQVDPAGSVRELSHVEAATHIHIPVRR